MTAALIAIVVIAVGVPLLAWRLGGRRFWSRLDSRTQPNLYAEMVRRHSLRPAETAQVESAVAWGRALEEPRLRLAVVDWAKASLDQADQYRQRHPRRWMFVVAATGLQTMLAVAIVVFAIAFDEAVPWFVIFVLVSAALNAAGPLLTQRNLRRAISLNSAEGTPED